MNYTTLTGTKATEGSIKSIVNWDEVPASFVLENAQAWIMTRMRVREMKTLATGDIEDGDTTLALPTRYRGTLYLGLAGDYRCQLSILDEKHFEDRLTLDSSGDLTEGTPTEVCVDGSTGSGVGAFRLNMEADQAYPYRHWYLQAPEPVSGSVATNFVTARYPQIMTAACAYWAYMVRRNSEEAERWASLAQAFIAEANDESDQELSAMRTEQYWRNP